MCFCQCHVSPAVPYVSSLVSCVLGNDMYPRWYHFCYRVYPRWCHVSLLVSCVPLSAICPRQCHMFPWQWHMYPRQCHVCSPPHTPILSCEPSRFSIYFPRNLLSTSDTILANMVAAGHKSGQVRAAWWAGRQRKGPPADSAAHSPSCTCCYDSPVLATE